MKFTKRTKKGWGYINFYNPFSGMFRFMNVLTEGSRRFYIKLPGVTIILFRWRKK